MRGSVDWQINTIFKQSGIFQPSRSRHNEKIEIKSQLGKAGQSRSSQAVADKSAIHAYETCRDYKDTWHKLGHYCRQEHGLKDMTKIDSSHVQSYLEKRMAEKVGFETWRKEATHLAKFGNALERFDGQPRAFRQSVADLRDLARDTLAHSSKDHGGFNQPDRVIQNLAGNDRIAAEIQLQGGARLREASQVRKDQLQGLQRDKITGVEKGVIHLKDTKGGKPREIQVSSQTYRQLEKVIQKNRGFQVNQKTYQGHVNAAAKLAGEQRTGTHDLRYNYAQTRYNEIINAGYNNAQAEQAVSWQMGHERADITRIYLR